MAKTKICRIGEENINNQGCLMKITRYIKADDIYVQFQDKYKTEVHTDYRHFREGGVKNPYYPTVHYFGIVGNKYPHTINGKMVKEYIAWQNILVRCCIKETKEKQRYRTYKNITCCEEWLLYENFYEWLHSQPNFNKWLNNDKWCMDKDILIKGNKIYSPETCCLIPQNVNLLFTKSNKTRGKYPIGVTYKTRDRVFVAQCNVNGKETYLGRRSTPEQAFLLYKSFKENLIKQIAQEEYDKGNITKQCYDAMMRYEVEITD